MTEFLTPLINEAITSKYSRIYRPFRFYSDVLGCEVEVPIDFIHDFESVPLIKGTSKRAGVGHDYLCRQDSVPIVTKKVAAQVYLELMAYRDGLPYRERTWISLFIRRWGKYRIVRIAWGYFHKLKVLATIEEVSA